MYAIRSYYVLCIAAGLSTLPSSALAQSKVGTSSAQFLGISVGPKAMGMGGAYVASNVITSYSIHYTKLYDSMVDNM